MARVSLKKRKRGKVYVIDLKEGGLGWQAIDQDGTPVKSRFGRVFVPYSMSKDSPEYQTSSRAIDKALKAWAEKVSDPVAPKGPKARLYRAGKPARILGARTLRPKATTRSRDLRGSAEELD